MSALMFTFAALAGEVPPGVTQELRDLGQRTSWPLEVIELAEQATPGLAEDLGVTSVMWASSVERFTVIAEGYAQSSPPHCAVILNTAEWSIAPFAGCVFDGAGGGSWVEDETATPNVATEETGGESAAATVRPRNAHKLLSWGGAGRIRWGNRAITTRRFAALTNDTETLEGLQKGRWVLMPGIVVTAAGLATAAIGVATLAIAVVLFVGQLFVCIATLGSECTFFVVDKMLLAGVQMMGVGISVSVVGSVLLAAGGVARLSQVRLMNWYTPSQIRDRVDGYNRVVEGRTGSRGPISPRGELVLGLGAPGPGGVLPGARLMATF